MHNLEKANLYGNPLSDQCLEYFADKQMLYMGLGATSVTDGGMAALAKIKSLKFLDVSTNRIDGKGLESLVELPQLEHLDLHNTAITSDDLPKLKNCRSLKELNLGSIKINDTAGAVLAELPIMALYLDHCQLSDKFLSLLSRSNTLRYLSLNNNEQITAKGLEKLSSLPFKGLWLDYTEATKGGLPERLKKMKSLRLLQLNDAPPEVMKDLRASLPLCATNNDSTHAHNPDLA